MHRMKHWIVQTSGLRAFGEDEKLIMEALKAEGIPWYSIGVIPFTNEITGAETLPHEPGFLHCSTKMLRILSDETIPIAEIFPNVHIDEAHRLYNVLRASVFYDPKKFDQSFYKNEYALDSERLLLNHGARIMRIGDIMHEELQREYFIKPASDLKLFKGGVFDPGMSLYQQVCAGGMVENAFLEAKDDLVVLAHVREVTYEYRFLVVDGEVITGSQYLVHGEVKYDADVPQRLYDEAVRVAKLYKPALAFTLDLCLTGKNEIKIVEYNCINASGLYHCDIRKFARVLAA